MPLGLLESEPEPPVLPDPIPEVPELPELPELPEVPELLELPELPVLRPLVPVLPEREVPDLPDVELVSRRSPARFPFLVDGVPFGLPLSAPP